MSVQLDLFLQHSGTGRLVEVRNLEDVRSVDPIVHSAAHDMIAVDIELVNGNLSRVSKCVKARLVTAIVDVRYCRWQSTPLLLDRRAP